MEYQEATMTVAELIENAGIKFYQEWVSTRPDGLMSEQPMNHYKCRISCGRRGYTLYFSQGLGLSGPPELDDVLDCLASDASGYENANSFEDWANDYGYDADSRSAERTWKAVKRGSEQLKRTIGPEAYNDLLWKCARA